MEMLPYAIELQNLGVDVLQEDRLQSAGFFASRAKSLRPGSVREVDLDLIALCWPAEHGLVALE
jgi:hypothetical protein